MRWRFVGMLMFLAIVSATVVSAAQNTGQTAPNNCPALVEFALETVGERCAALGRNQVCYGHNLLTVQDANGALLANFSSSGDVTPVEEVGTLQTAAMDIENSIWGVAVMALQANVQGTLPGQNVIFVVYGAAEVTAAPVEDVRFSAPMQAFRLSTGIGQPACSEAPRDGVLLQSPDGTTVNFLVNGVEIQMGSTVLLDVRNEDELWVSTLAGEATVTAEGESQTVLPGEKVLVKPGQPPHGHAPYANTDVQGVPVSLLPEPVHVPFIVDPAAATAGWIESPYTLESGQTYTLTASGEINIYEECDAESLATVNLTCEDMVFGPNGGANLGTAPDDYPLPGGRVGALIGRVGLYGETFLIGPDVTFIADASGTLFLRINDAYFPEDNSGAFIVALESDDTD